jgi:hypothetical protein
MTDSSPRKARPLGVDLGSATTTGAVIEEGSPRVLDVDGQSTLPTRLAITSEGIVVGTAAVQADTKGMTPLPYLDNSPTGVTPEDLPLPVFLRELRRIWAASLPDVQPVTDGGEDQDGNVEDIEGVKRVDTDETTADANDEPNEDATGINPAESEEGGEDTADDRTIIKNQMEAQEATDADDGTESGSPSEDNADEADASVNTQSTREQGTDESEDAAAEPIGTEGNDGEPRSVNGDGAFAPTTITVPGPYAGSDLAAVETALEAAGFGDPLAVRAPVAVAATELPTCESEQTVAVADIGSSWGSFAVIRVRPNGTLSVAARTSLTDHGRKMLDDALATWVIDKIGRDHGVTFRLNDDAKARVREATHDALDTVAGGEDGSVTIDLELSEGVEVVEGGVFDENALSPTVEITMDNCFDALADHLREIQDCIDHLLTATSVDTIDTLLLTGDGTRPAPALFAIENAFDRRSQPPAQGDRYTAASIGAALLASARVDSDGPVVDDTYDRNVELRALGESGPEERRLNTPGSAPGRPCEGDLVPVSDTQLSGTFEIHFSHRITGEREYVGTYVCSGLPTGGDGPGQLTVSFDAPSAGLEASQAGDAVAVEPSSEGAGSEMDASVADSGAVSERSVELSITRDNDTDAPWLAHATVDRTDLPAPERSNDDGMSGLVPTSDVERAVKAVDDESVARAAWKLRNKLWKQGVKKGDGLPGDDLKLLFREIDQNLSIASIEIIKPEPGSTLDDRRHWVVEPRETHKPTGTILEVRSLGVAVDGNVLEQAEVAVAK